MLGNEKYLLFLFLFYSEKKLILNRTEASGFVKIQDEM